MGERLRRRVRDHRTWPSCSWTRRARSSSPRKRCTAAASACTPRSTSTCRAGPGAPSPSVLEPSRATRRPAWWRSTTRAWCGPWSAAARATGRRGQARDQLRGARRRVEGRPVGSTFKPIALAEAVATGKSLESRYDAPGKHVSTSPRSSTSRATCAASPVEGQQLRRERGRQAQPHGGHRPVLQHGVRPADGRPRARQGRRHGQEAGHAGRLRAPGAPRWCSAPRTPARSTWPASTRCSPTRASRRPPTLITRVDKIGDEGEVTTLYNRPPPAGERVLTPQQADLVTHTLQGVISDGTGHAADIGRPAAGKTGTSQAQQGRLVRRLRAQAHRRGVDGLPQRGLARPGEQRRAVDPAHEPARQSRPRGVGDGRLVPRRRSGTTSWSRPSTTGG